MHSRPTVLGEVFIFLLCTSPFKQYNSPCGFSKYFFGRFIIFSNFRDLINSCNVNVDLPSHFCGHKGFSYQIRLSMFKVKTFRLSQKKYQFVHSATFLSMFSCFPLKNLSSLIYIHLTNKTTLNQLPSFERDHHYLFTYYFS